MLHIWMQKSHCLLLFTGMYSAVSVKISFLHRLKHKCTVGIHNPGAEEWDLPLLPTLKAARLPQGLPEWTQPPVPWEGSRPY